MLSVQGEGRAVEKNMPGVGIFLPAHGAGGVVSKDTIDPGRSPHGPCDEPEEISGWAILFGSEVVLSELPDSMEVQNLRSAMRIEVLDFSPDGLGSFGVQVVPVMETEYPLHCRRGGFDKVDLPIVCAYGGCIEESPACTGGGPMELGDGTIRPSPAILSECLVSLDGGESLN